MPLLDWSDMPIHEAIRSDWKTPEILIEGSLNCAKTTLCLDKEIDAILKYPGIPSLGFRWSDDAVQTKLKPAFEDILDIRGIDHTWDKEKKRYEFPNGSLVYMFGLKAVSLVEMFNKIRGLGVSRIFGDQVEEMARAVAGELRGRLRPDLKATMNQTRYPFQLTFVANPDDNDFWLSKEFPVDNHIKGRKLYQLSIFDNKHLPQESKDSLLRQFPPGHPKHQTMVLGQRGPNITGDAVYEGLYRKDVHQRALSFRPEAKLFEAFEFGKHNPVWVIAQPLYGGGLALLGGIMGEGLMMEDMLPIVKQKRMEWFGHPSADVKSCSGPMGDKSSASVARYTLLNLLRAAGVKLVWRDNANAPDVRLAMIEEISGYLRRRNSRGEDQIGVNSNPDMWLRATTDGVNPYPFLHFGFEGGAVWSEHFVSVSNKQVRVMREDDKFANAMHCVENLMLNFCVNRPSEDEREARRVKLAEDSLRHGGQAPAGWLGS